MSPRLIAAAVMSAVLCLAHSASAGDIKYPGYTYVAPSYYLAPPVYYAPFAPPPFAAPVQIYGPSRVTAPPVIAVEPAFLHTTVVPYDPVWNYGGVLPGTAYRQRGSARPREYEYSLKTFGPPGQRYRNRVEVEPNEVEVHQRYR
ncbi:MAG: hypothetical protein SH850_06135 [Planctomycetaceae bacterium]|nr:hypothetical protein [Planctomycetaceae bacterium]